MKERVALLGASNKPDRYAYMAFKMLQEYGHQVYPVHPSLEKVDEIQVFKMLGDLKEPVDTLTMYVGPQISKSMAAEIIALHPKRVIFNPGTENPDLQTTLEKNGIQTLEACTLVMLRSNQFHFQ